MTSPYVDSLFIIVLKKQIFEKLRYQGERPEVRLEVRSFSLKEPLVGARNVLVKNLVVGQKILILKRGSIMEWGNFLKGLQGVFGENRKLHNCNIIN